MNKKARYLVHLIFLYTCVEGLVINVQYPSKLPFIYKDVLILVVYAALVMSGRNSDERSGLLTRALPPLLFFAFVMAVYLLLPGASLLGGIVALKQRLFYVPLMFAGYAFTRSEEDVKRFLMLLVVYSIGVSLFGIYLYYAGPDGLHRLGANYSAEITTAQFRQPTEVYWRVPGTFNSPGQYGAYLFFNGLIAISLLMTGSLSKKWRILVAVALLLILLALLSAGSRAPLVMLSASVALLLMLTRQLKRLAVVGLVGYVVLAFAFTFMGAGVEDRFASIVAYDNVERFQDTYFGQLFLPELLKKPLGSGLGIATIGARHLSELSQPVSVGARNDSEQDFLLTESYLGILAVETGVLGLSAFLWVSITIGTATMKARKFIRSSQVASPTFALAVYVISTLLVLPVSTAIDHAPMNLYFWFSIGMVFRVAEIERRKRISVQITEHQPVFYQTTLASR